MPLRQLYALLPTLQHALGRWPSLEQLGVVCEGKPMTRQVEKSALERIPSYLEKIVDKMNMEHNKLANDYMALVRSLTSENKVEVKRLQNDIIIYLETATLPFETALMLTNDNVF